MRLGAGVGVVLGLQLIPGAPRLTLIGTGSSELLAVFGGVVAAVGKSGEWVDRDKLSIAIGGVVIAAMIVLVWFCKPTKGAVLMH